MSDRQDIMGCYFRSWRDIATGDPDNKVSMRDLPAEVDIAFVFPDGNEPPRYWEALHSQIIPALHARETKIVRTIAIDELIKPGASANDIFTRFFTSTPGLDGLDIDIEHTLNEAQRKQAEAVSRELRTLLGQERLFVFDTTENGDVALIRALAPQLNYILFQAYGQTPARVQGHYDRMFKDFLPPSRFMVGFSFYEERGTRWGDVRDPLESSTAHAYAAWTPTQGPKAGIFSYAVDRDGVKEGDDTLQPTNFAWTKHLKAAMAPRRRRAWQTVLRNWLARVLRIAPSR
ncbi:EndoS/ChiA family endoglycosidase [Pseudomonas soli]|uniref:mannosyl-glycoprotein endo-beta-N-acetylglucosaminidase n=1 Tax=Pseudomonas soli TaxID=1306993 RepID=A0A1H9FFD0_9PSED|nr:hypothetical protein [Pseudomonas soli]SEQ36173.1 hypothetical protein SAMN05216230_102525 [Pseudomonas soli]